MSNQKSGERHLLLIAASAQGHLNPTLQLAKRLIRSSPSIHVTLATNTMSHALPHFNLPPPPPSSSSSPSPYLHRLSFATFSTGFDDPVNVKHTHDPQSVALTSKHLGSPSLRDLILSLSKDGRPIHFLVYSLMLPWAADVARQLHVPSALFFIQSATTFAIYNRYFNTTSIKDNHDFSIQLPGLPLFKSSDIPTFLLPSSPHYFAAPTIQDHLKALDGDPYPTLLINSFDALEQSVIDHYHHRLKIFTIGPLIPSAFSDMIDPSDTSYGCDLFQSSNDYLPWLENKAEKSVVYVSFGSMTVMKRKQFDEILNGLELTGRPYLWVVRPMTHYEVVGQHEEEVLMKDVVQHGLGPVSGNPKEKGLIVPWCSQVEVLNHPTIGCFLTHCGWNSILECLVMGVPIVGVPQISDQPTNAKLVEQVWEVGLKAKSINEENNIVDRHEIKRCIEVVMGDEEIGEKIRRNSKKWMELALQATMEQGSSNNNLGRFIQSIQNNGNEGTHN